MMMAKKYIYILLLTILPALNSHSEVFNTSKCFDLLCSPQYFEKLAADSHFADLSSDSVFIANLEAVNANCKASNLCNLYAQIDGNKDDITKCLSAIQHFDSLASGIEWAKGILSVKPQLEYVIQKIAHSGYSEYWDKTVYPTLKSHIDNYDLNPNLLNSIHSQISDFFAPQALPETQSRIYVLGIKNAFNLSDESFCCTPRILNHEIEKKLRLNFLNIYIHENLHNLYLSPDLMAKLSELDNDSFYYSRESIAQQHGEGRNEAFVVAAEVYVSNRLGLRDAQNVFDEFSQYVEGSLVLAPIIYVNLQNRRRNESYNDFLLRLFNDGTLKVGEI
ncbi:MAG: hypothetical protein ACI4UL_09300, partial [Muribaculaceae bacterium]